ncbi:MAG: ArnT family glycosyltransferase [Lentimicrobium sp.]
MKHITLVKVLVLFTFLLFIYSLWQRSPDIDDAWIGEHAYWMAENGYVKSELMHGITMQDKRHIVHHKFYTLNGALFIKMFGFSLFTIKSVSLLWLSIFLLVFIGYVRRNMGNDAAWFALLITISNALIFQYSFVFRPEILVMTLGFLSYLFLDRYLKGEYVYILLITSGLFAGLAAASHLNGLIFMAAGAVLLLVKKHFKAAIIFSLFTLPAFSVYFFDFTSRYDVYYWLYQINDSPALHKSTILPSSIAFLGKIFNEHLRFFHSPKEISFSLLFLFILLVNYRNLKSEGNLMKYLLLLVIFLSLLAVHSTSKYILLYLPYIVLIILKSFHNFYHNRNNLLSLRWGITTPGAYKSTLVLIGIYLVINMVWNTGIAIKKFDPGKNRQLSLKHMGNNTANLNILAPMTFIFNEIGHYKRIQSDLSIVEMQKAGKGLSGLSFLSYADSLQINYLIITDEYRNRFGIDRLKPEDYLQYGYTVSEIEPGMIILNSTLPLAYE